MVMPITLIVQFYLNIEAGLQYFLLFIIICHGPFLHISRCHVFSLFAVSVSCNGENMCENECDCGDISASLLASLVASPAEKFTASQSSNFCQSTSLEIEHSTSYNVCVQTQSYSTARHNKNNSYSSPSAPLFGKPSSICRDESTGVTHIEINQNIITSAYAAEGSTQQIQTAFSLSRVPPLINSPELQLRFLNPSDIPEVKRLCREWFPIEYPDAWYSDITSNHKFYR